jgi:hypothetical protein
MVEALGPMMGASIKQQIAIERDAMVDALYPVIGNTIAKYMKDAIASINEKVRNTFSVEGVSRKLRARIQGVSEAELILREAMPYRVRAAFLIHKASGLVMSEAQFSEQEPLEGDMLAGMLTAIRSFVSDCIVQGENVSELHEIQYNDSQIAMEVAGYCYLAAIVQGEPSKAFYRHLRSTLVRLVERYDRPIQSFDGDPSTLPQAIHLAVAALVRQTISPQQQQSRPVGFPWALTGLITGIVWASAVPWPSAIAPSSVPLKRPCAPRPNWRFTICRCSWRAISYPCKAKCPIPGCASRPNAPPPKPIAPPIPTAFSKRPHPTIKSSPSSCLTIPCWRPQRWPASRKRSIATAIG